jgi:hypothetical protein
MEILDSNISIQDDWLGKPVTKHVKDFGVLIGAIFLLIGAAKLYFGFKMLIASIWIVAGLLFILGGIYSPKLLLPVWYYWMKFALVLGTVMTFVIITLAWCIMFIPIGLLFKLIGKRTVNLSFKTNTDSYWEQRDEKYNDFKLLERQF